MLKRGDNKKEGMLDADDLERASLTGKERKDESKMCCTKNLIGLTLLSIVGVISLYLGGNYYISTRAVTVTEARNSNATNTVQNTATTIIIDDIMEPPPHREFGIKTTGKWKLHSSSAPIPYYQALGMDKFMANIVTKLDSVMEIALTSDGFVQTSTVTGLAGAFLPHDMKTHIVKPIFGKKIEGIYNGISKDKEDWFATAFPDRWEIYVTHHDLTINGGDKLSEQMTMKLRTVTVERNQASKKEIRELTIHRVLNDEASTECTWYLRPAK
jgi:hypothetical protein